MQKNGAGHGRECEADEAGNDCAGENAGADKDQGKWFDEAHRSILCNSHGRETEPRMGRKQFDVLETAVAEIATYDIRMS